MELIVISEEELLDALQEDESNFTSDESAEDEEKPKEHVKCLKCGYEFNPEHFKVDSIIEELEEEDIDVHIRTGTPRDIGRARALEPFGPP